MSEAADRIETEWYTAGAPTRLPRRRDRIVLDAPAKLLTMNAAKKTHPHEWADLTAAWREACRDRAQLLEIEPASGRVGIDATPHQRGGILADPGAHMPCVKACVDGLRDAGVLVDDTGEFVAWVLCRAPVKAETAGMVIQIVRL